MSIVTPELSALFADAAQYFPTPLQQFQFFDKTSRFDYEKGRRETWPETVDRAISYLAELAPPMTDWLRSEGRHMILTMQALPSMRLLAMAGPAARRQNLSIYNCFAGEEEFLTPEGPQKFAAAVGQHVIVRAADGKWKAATVQHFGRQPLVQVTLRHWNGTKAGSYLHKVKVTPNHRWLLLSGKETTALCVGDKLRPSSAPVFAQNTEAERHGFVFGDGTLTHTGKYTYGMVRLCGAKQKYLATIFAGCGHSYPPGCKGDPMVYLGRAGAKYKTLPESPTPDYARGFIDGLGKADGALTDGGNLRIDTQKPELLAWLKKYAPLAGYVLLSVRTYTKPTNYGPRKAPLHQILLGRAETSVFRVEAVEPLDVVEDVYCVVEPETHSFVLGAGIATGNCAYMPVDDIQAFVEMLIISMSGCGVGFSVEQHNIDKLPPVAVQTGEYRGTHVVSDSTEGWAAALRAGLDAWWLGGYDTDFDVAQVRPAGAVLRTKGGRASGPEPLLRMLNTIKGILLARQGQRLRSIDAHDIACAVGDAAVSGGMRRTAMISLYSKGDALMRMAKVGDYPAIRWNANNSEVWREDPTDAEIEAQMGAMFAGQNGEPGIFSGAAAERTMLARRREMWQTDLGVSVRESAGTNPCQPAFATVLTPEGIRTFADINVGSVIWSGKQWTRVVRKVATGVKPVHMYVAESGHFIGTEDHRVVSEGVKIPVKDAVTIDTAPFPSDLALPIEPTYDVLFSKRSFTKNPIMQTIPLGEHPVYDITVEADEHTYWTGGLLVSNCGEIVLRPMGLCNLSIAVARPDDTIESLRRKVVAATAFGTIQATATHFPGLRPQWKANAECERLLGVDITGQMDCPLLRGVGAKEVFANLRYLTRWVNALVAKILDIAPAAAITTVKPAGNSAVLLNCGSGVHGRHSRYYVRNARVSAHSPIYRVLRDAGVPLSPENGQTEENATTWVCAFPCRVSDDAVLKSDLSAQDQLAHWLLNKRHWTDHNPSCTITYRPDEEAGIVEWVKAHREEIGGISFLPAFDAAYEQMPYVEIEQTEYEARLAAFPSIDWSRIALYEATDTTTAAQEVVCTGDRCELR